MDLRKEMIKTEGRKPLLDAFQSLASVEVNEFQTRDGYSSLDLINVMYNLCIHSREKKVKVML
jgi:hypothetical protein